ncbi:MAG: glycosyltransferase family 1 protein [Nitrospiraceae bacterium]|nr:MAG: glycosyltransferase family 1 protein [Nitrospiraceae bacterium]
MNIIYHHRTQGKGVEGVHIREIVRAWQKMGHKVEMVEPPAVSVWNESSGNKKAGFPAKVYKIISRYVPEIVFEIFEATYNFNAGGRLRKIFRKDKYSFLYERYALFNWSGAKEARRAGVPLVLEVNYTNHTPLYRRRSSIMRPFVNLAEKWIFKNADGFIVVSTYLKKHLIGLGVDKEKIIVLTNAADPEKFSPLTDGREIRSRYELDGRVVTGFVGGFYPWHGLDLLIDSFKSLAGDCADAVLLLVGDGPMKPSLEKKVLESGLQDRVYFPGTISHEDLPKYISAFDIAIMPDSNEYGSPMKIFEYMAMGKPVVAPKFGPLEDGITHGKEGFLFEPQNANDLVSCLRRLIDNADLRRELGKNGRTRIMDRHNWQNNAVSVLDLVDSSKGKGKEPVTAQRPVSAK